MYSTSCPGSASDLHPSSATKFGLKPNSNGSGSRVPYIRQNQIWNTVRSNTLQRVRYDASSTNFIQIWIHPFKSPFVQCHTHTLISLEFSRACPSSGPRRAEMYGREQSCEQLTFSMVAIMHTVLWYEQNILNQDGSLKRLG